MTKKDYELIARVIKDSTIINRRDITYIDKDLLLHALCYQLKQDNSLFNKDRFVKACSD